MTKKRKTISEASDQIDRIENGIYGNGRKGLLERTTDLEANILHTEEDVRILYKSLDALTNNTQKFIEGMNAFKATMETHCNAPHLNTLIQKKSFWGVMFLAVVLVNVLSTYIPNVINIILTGLGIPFQLPLT